MNATALQRNKMRKIQIAWNKGLTKYTDLRVKKYAEKLKGKTYEEIHGKEEANKVKEKLHFSHTGKPNSNKGKVFEEIYGEKKAELLKENKRGNNFSKKWWENHPEEKEKKSNWMKINGNRIRKLIRRFSKDELKLRSIVKELYPTSEHTYKVLESKDYDVDIAILEFKIAIEYDGYFHFCDQEHIDYHNKRQQEIQLEGWKFIRYTIFDKFPTKEKVKKDISKLLKNKE